MLVNEDRTKTLNDLVLKVEELGLKREIEQAAEAAKVGEELIEGLFSVLVDASQKGENLLGREEVIGIPLTIGVDVTHDVLSCTTDGEDGCVLID